VRPHLTLCVVAALSLTACGSGRTTAPSRVALSFSRAVAGGDGQGACALIAPQTRHDLESSQGKPCAQSVLEQRLPVSHTVTRAEQYGDEAQVVLDKDVTFVAHFSIGWRVVAAGCTDRGKDVPYDCTLKGG
jgi:hypothetical protein